MRAETVMKKGKDGKLTKVKKYKTRDPGVLYDAIVEQIHKGIKPDFSKVTKRKVKGPKTRRRTAPIASPRQRDQASKNNWSLVFNPNRPCGTGARTKNAYKLNELRFLAQIYKIPKYNTHKSSVLCQLLREKSETFKITDEEINITPPSSLKFIPEIPELYAPPVEEQKDTINNYVTVVANILLSLKNRKVALNDYDAFRLFNEFENEIKNQIPSYRSYKIGKVLFRATRTLLPLSSLHSMFFHQYKRQNKEKQKTHEENWTKLYKIVNKISALGSPTAQDRRKFKRKYKPFLKKLITRYSTEWALSRPPLREWFSSMRRIVKIKSKIEDNFDLVRTSLTWWCTTDSSLIAKDDMREMMRRSAIFIGRETWKNLTMKEFLRKVEIQNYLTPKTLTKSIGSDSYFGLVSEEQYFSMLMQAFRQHTFEQRENIMNDNNELYALLRNMEVTYGLIPKSLTETIFKAKALWKSWSSAIDSVADDINIEIHPDDMDSIDSPEIELSETQAPPMFATQHDIDSCDKLGGQLMTYNNVKSAITSRYITKIQEIKPYFTQAKNAILIGNVWRLNSTNVINNFFWSNYKGEVCDKIKLIGIYGSESPQVIAIEALKDVALFEPYTGGDGPPPEMPDYKQSEFLQTEDDIKLKAARTVRRAELNVKKTKRSRRSRLKEAVEALNEDSKDVDDMEDIDDIIDDIDDSKAQQPRDRIQCKYIESEYEQEVCKFEEAHRKYIAAHKKWVEWTKRTKPALDAKVAEYNRKLEGEPLRKEGDEYSKWSVDVIWLESEIEKLKNTEPPKPVKPHPPDKSRYMCTKLVGKEKELCALHFRRQRMEAHPAHSKFEQMQRKVPAPSDKPAWLRQRLDITHKRDPSPPSRSDLPSRVFLKRPQEREGGFLGGLRKIKKGLTRVLKVHPEKPRRSRRRRRKAKSQEPEKMGTWEFTQQ